MAGGMMHVLGDPGGACVGGAFMGGKFTCMCVGGGGVMHVWKGGGGGAACARK